jgi:hypothetical protein
MIYRLLKPSEENPQEREVAKRALQEVADALGISPDTELHFFIEGRYWDPPRSLFEIQGTCDAFSQAGKIFITTGLEERYLEKVTRHEAKHCEQYAQWDKWGGHSYETRERDARIFELSFSILL